MKKILENIRSVQKPEAILLDWDNTLADSWKIIHKCLNKTFNHFGMEEWSLDDVIAGHSNIHHSLRESFPVLFGDKWEQAKEIYYNSFVECHLDEIELLPGALETLESLKNMNVHLAIVSNKTGKHLRSELKHLGIDHYFDEIIGAQDAEKDKPHKEPILMALRSSTIHENNFHNVWMIGDSKTDIEAAFAAGVTPVLYGNADIGDKFDRTKILKIDTQEEFRKVAENWKDK